MKRLINKVINEYHWPIIITFVHKFYKLNVTTIMGLFFQILIFFFCFFAEERRYKCNFCSAAFFHPHHLQRHEKKLHKMGKQIKPNQCQDCFKTFATPLTLKYHKDFACKMVQRPHRCLECQLGFKSTEELKKS